MAMVVESLLWGGVHIIVCFVCEINKKQPYHAKATLWAVTDTWCPPYVARATVAFDKGMAVCRHRVALPLATGVAFVLGALGGTERALLQGNDNWICGGALCEGLLCALCGSPGYLEGGTTPGSSMHVSAWQTSESSVRAAVASRYHHGKACRSNNNPHVASSKIQLAMAVYVGWMGVPCHATPAIPIGHQLVSRQCVAGGSSGLPAEHARNKGTL